MPRKQKKYHYIYKTTCQVTGKFYVGMHSTDNLEDGYLGSGKILKYSVNKHGDENHIKEILEFLPSREALKLREKEIVDESLLVHPLNMNLKYGGEGGFDHLNTPSNIQHKVSASILGGNAFSKKCKSDKRFLDAFKATCVKTRGKLQANGLIQKPKKFTFAGKQHTPQAKQKMSAADRTGEKNSQYGSCWVSDGMKPIKIRKEQLDEYLLNGYSKGRNTRDLSSGDDTTL